MTNLTLVTTSPVDTLPATRGMGVGERIETILSDKTSGNFGEYLGYTL